MATILNPYLTFRSDAAAAMAFYQSVFGGELTSMGFEGMGLDEPGVMHSQLTTPGGLTLMAADTPSHMEWSPGASVSVSLSGTDEAELTGFWERLSVGAEIGAPLMKAPWGDTFGMCTDTFGVQWMVNITAS